MGTWDEQRCGPGGVLPSKEMLRNTCCLGTSGHLHNCDKSRRWRQIHGLLGEKTIRFPREESWATAKERLTSAGRGRRFSEGTEVAVNPEAGEGTAFTKWP